MSQDRGRRYFWGCRALGRGSRQRWHWKVKVLTFGQTGFAHFPSPPLPITLGKPGILQEPLSWSSSSTFIPIHLNIILTLSSVIVLECRQVSSALPLLQVLLWDFPRTEDKI